MISLHRRTFGLFSSAENSDLTFDVFCSETAFCQSGPYLVLGIRREFFPYLFDTCGGDSLFCFLFKVAYFQEIPLRDGTGNRRDKSQQASKECRLADSVGAGEDDFLTAFHLDAEGSAQRFVIADDQIFRSEDIPARRSGNLKV